MLTLLSLLQTRRDWPGQVLADRLEVTTRTVRRDVERLRSLGYEIASTKGPDGGYRLGAGAEVPPLLFDDDQAIAIAIGLQHAAASGADIGEAAERALATVRQVMPSRLRNRIDAVQFSRPPASVGINPVDPGVIEAVSRAIRAQLTMRFDYGEPASSRLTEPHGLVARSGRWYLVGWDLDRRAWRTFRLDRMTPAKTPGPPFTPRPIPTGDASTFLTARFKGSEHADHWPCIGEFEIDLPAAALAVWVHDGEITESGPNSSRVTMGSWSWEGLIASIIRFDAPFRIVGPDELVTASLLVAERLITSARL